MALVAAAEHEFRLMVVSKSGTSRRAMLEQVAKTTGHRPADLDGPGMPRAAQHVWEWFLELCSGRAPGFNGPAPISWGDLKAWCDLTGSEPRPHEVGMLRALDAAFLRVFSKREK